MAALATITPCPVAPGNLGIQPITVTEQYQPVWTCNPTSVCNYGDCTTSYPMSTYDYLSTVIPCAWSGTSASTCTITATDEPVTVSQMTSTMSSAAPYASGSGQPGYFWNGTHTASAGPTNTYVIVKHYVQPFHQLGPLAMPGWGGSGHCQECQPEPNGPKYQPMGIHQCQDNDCQWFTETWVSQTDAPTRVAPVSAACSTSTALPSAGTYSFPFPQWAPESTITIPASTVTVTVGGYPTMSHVPRSTVTMPPQPWTGWVTKTCHGPTIVDFTTTITDTVTYTVPCSTITATVTVTSTTSNIYSPTLTSTSSSSTSNIYSPTLSSTTTTSSSNIISPTLTSTTETTTSSSSIVLSPTLTSTTFTSTPQFPNSTTTTSSENTINPTLTSSTSSSSSGTTTPASNTTTTTTTSENVSPTLTSTTSSTSSETTTTTSNSTSTTTTSSSSTETTTTSSSSETTTTSSSSSLVVSPTLTSTTSSTETTTSTSSSSETSTTTSSSMSSSSSETTTTTETSSSTTTTSQVISPTLTSTSSSSSTTTTTGPPANPTDTSTTLSTSTTTTTADISGDPLVADPTPQFGVNISLKKRTKAVRGVRFGGRFYKRVA